VKIKGPVPFRFVVGVGCSRGCPVDELLALIDATMAGRGELAALATIDRRADEPCVLAAARGVPLVTYAAEELAAVNVPTPSKVVARHVGTASVAEAAALLAGGELVVSKRKSEHATCAVATWPG
jgi:cobalamin biosynthesis protein CbiG